QTNAVCPAGPYTNVDLTKAPAGCTFTPGNGNVNAIDPSLKIPTAWKGNLTATYDADFGRFGDDWRFTAAYLKSVNENALIWYNLRSVQTGVAPDGRPVFSQSTQGDLTGNENDFLLTNTKKGSSESIAFRVDKAWREGIWDGLSWGLSYTHTQAEDANPMTSSVAQSSYTRYGTFNPQNPPAETSDYEIRDSWTMDFGYARNFFGDNETSIRVFAQNRTGLPFSYTFAGSRTGNFDNDFGYNVSSYSGRQASSNALFYVPQMAGGSITATSDPRVQYATGFDVAAFDAFVKSSGLSAYAGGIAPRNAFNTPDVTTVDLRISQELPAFFPGGAKLQVYMDLENLGNLLNDEWGVLEQYDFHRSVPVATVSCVARGTTTATSCGAPNAAYLYSGSATGSSPYVVPNASLWQVKFGVKYKF
ncbi:MAG: TonB-dependent receptor, partial [Brevundimonas sp.]|nr:TonB-dependent receptor [Brevundimonas sp.]